MQKSIEYIYKRVLGYQTITNKIKKNYLKKLYGFKRRNSLQFLHHFIKTLRLKNLPGRNNTLYEVYNPVFSMNVYVMQSDGNSYSGYVVLDSVNKATRDDNNILDQIYNKRICSDCYYDD